MRVFLLILISMNLAADQKSFEKVKTIFQEHCLKCHSSSNAAESGGLNMETLEGMKKGGTTYTPGLVIGKGEISPIYFFTNIPPGPRSKVMPPQSFGAPLSKKEKEIIKEWIDKGAYWPEGVKLKYKLPERITLKSTEVYNKIFKNYQSSTFKNYKSQIPGPKNFKKPVYEMVAIKGGVLKKGQKTFNIDDFWMGKYEVTWEEYEAYSQRLLEFDKPFSTLEKVVPLVSHPTPPYVDMTFGMGKKRRPAICMTQLAAKSYCVWLSAKTGHFYRLPTEAEWEYACKAGTTTKYYWGNDFKKYSAYEWFFDNSNDKYNEIGTKKPNPFGLHDMLGNVSEWCLDSHRKNFFDNASNNNPLSLPIKGVNHPAEAEWPFKIYGRIAKGGNYNDDINEVSVERQLLSNPTWKNKDPQLPKSVWWMTDSIWVGFRIVRAKNIPSIEDLYKYWPTDEEILSIPKR